MKRRTRKHQEEEEDVSYDGRPHPNLLDYRYMDIEMTKWASTDNGCMSIVAVLILACLCLITVMLLTAIRGA